jgi:hypothetical protein
MTKMKLRVITHKAEVIDLLTGKLFVAHERRRSNNRLSGDDDDVFELNDDTLLALNKAVV